MAAACSSPQPERYLPLQVTNAPTCPPGQTPHRLVILRLEHNADVVQQGLEHPELPSSWAGRQTRLKIGLCPSTSPCEPPLWTHTLDTTIVARANKLHITIPPLELSCIDAPT